MHNLVIHGIGGMAKETLWLVDAINMNNKEFNFIGFTVDDLYYKDGLEIMGYPVYQRDWLISHKDEIECVCAIGYPIDRKKVMTELENEGVKFATLIHPYAFVADKDNIGVGTIIGSFSYLSENVKLGKGVFLNSPMVSIGHDCILEDYVTCFPKAQISGGCRIGEAALIGSLSYIHEKKKVGKEAVVAPGSIVMRNVKDSMHVFGNPARVIEI